MAKLFNHAVMVRRLDLMMHSLTFPVEFPEEVHDPSTNVVESSKKIAKSHCGHLYVPPSVEDVQVFKIAGPKFIKLNVGTWHAGPLFVPDAMDFCNLELSNTNEVDHTTHSFAQEDGVCFVIDE